MSAAALELADLRVTFPSFEGPVVALDGLTLSVAAGQFVGVVGESGAGKTLLSMLALGLVHAPRARVGGSIRVAGQDPLSLGAAELRALRGGSVGFVSGNPLASLDPAARLGEQLADAILAHRPVSASAARDRAIDLLELVGIPEPHRSIDLPPTRLSPEFAQRVMIAIALANQPALLLLDEPTAGLGIVGQAGVLSLVARLQARLGVATVLLTRDIRIASAVAHELAIMHRGRIIERASPAEIYRAPQQRYTWSLLRALPRLGRPRDEELQPVDRRPGVLDLSAGVVR